MRMMPSPRYQPLHRYFRQYDDGGHQTASSDSSLRKEVHQILQDCPDCIHHVDLDNEHTLPLHAALEEIPNVNLDLIEDLVQAYPDSVKARDSDKKLPIHYACEHYDQSHRSSVNVIRYLLDQYPESITMTDTEKFTPLHYVCYNYQQNNDHHIKLQQDHHPQHQQHQSVVVFEEIIDLFLDRWPSNIQFDDFLLRLIDPKSMKHDQLQRIIFQTKGVVFGHSQNNAPDLFLHALCYIPSGGNIMLHYLQQQQQLQQQQRWLLSLLLTAKDVIGNTILHTFLKRYHQTNKRIFTTFGIDSKTSSRSFIEKQDEKLTMKIFQQICYRLQEVQLELQLEQPSATSCVDWYQNDDGDTPLHTICSHKLPLKYMNEVVWQLPQTAIDCPNTYGQLPIHMLFVSHNNLDGTTPKRPSTHHYNKRLKTSNTNSEGSPHCHGDDDDVITIVDKVDSRCCGDGRSSTTRTSLPPPSDFYIWNAIQILIHSSSHTCLLSIADPRTGLAPFGMATAAAAVNKNVVKEKDYDSKVQDEDAHQVDMTFRILREDPSSLMTMMEAAAGSISTTNSNTIITSATTMSSGTNNGNDTSITQPKRQRL